MTFRPSWDIGLSVVRHGRRRYSTNMCTFMGKMVRESLVYPRPGAGSRFTQPFTRRYTHATLGAALCVGLMYFKFQLDREPISDLFSPLLLHFPNLNAPPPRANPAPSNMPVPKTALVLSNRRSGRPPPPPPRLPPPWPWWCPPLL